MGITIKKVSTKKELKRFIRFNYELYKGNQFFVPELLSDMLDTFNKDKNAAYDFCESECFVAYKDGKMVGRVAAIINNKANEVWNEKNVRFGWIDFVDDIEVSSALLKAVEDWGKERGMNRIVGPLGFTDFDPEGMLVEGYDELSTMATIYNYPYYKEHVEKLGYEKEVDWIEYKIFVPEEVPDKHRRISEMIMQRYNLKIVKSKTRKELKEKYGKAIFNLINETYKKLYGYSSLTERQMTQYVKQYLPMIDPRLITMVEDANGEMVAVGISMPSLSEAMRKAKGKLLPFGWFHLWRALFTNKKSECFDLLLIAVKDEYQNKGVNALLFYDLIPITREMGFTYAESNPELEENGKVQAQWEYFENKQHKRRRAYAKNI